MDGLSAMLNLVNYVFVLIFGIVVSFYFADITWEDNKKTIISTLVAFVKYAMFFWANAYFTKAIHLLYIFL